jgi:hypothetical protein
MGNVRGRKNTLSNNKSLLSPEGANQNLFFFYVEDGDMDQWLSRSTAAYARSPKVIPTLHEYFSKKGVSYCLPRHIGGNNDVLFTFDRVELMHDMSDDVCDWLSRWFDMVKPWEPNLIATECFVCLREESVPLQA